jgi:two-component system LytT family response regulator
MKHRCIIIDDETHALQLLGEYIRMIPELELFKSYDDPVKALGEINLMDNISIIFMDINMPLISGLELAELIRNKTTHLIFTTAHADYAIQAFDFQATHYLLKPIGFLKFAAVVKKIIDEAVIYTKNGTLEDDTVFIRTELKNKLIKITVREIMVVEAMNNYIQIYTEGITHTAYLTMKELKKLIGRWDGFIQVHKSFIINRNYITNIEGTIIRMANKLSIPIGATYKEEFEQYVKQKTLKSGRLN